MRVRVKGYTRKDGKKVKGYSYELKAGKKRGGKTSRSGQVQYGRTNLVRDGKRKAKPPGRRKADSGRIYTEHRRNRSDIDTKGRKGSWV